MKMHYRYVIGNKDNVFLDNESTVNATVPKWYSGRTDRHVSMVRNMYEK